MTDVAVLSIPIEANTRDIDAALKRVERQSNAVKPVVIPGDASGLTAAMTQAERATLSFAQARARLLKDQGDLVGAERVLQGALGGTRASTVQTIAVERQLIAVRRQLAGATTDVGRGSGAFAQIGSELGGMLRVATPAALAVGGVATALGVAGAAMLTTADRARQITQSLGELEETDLSAVIGAAGLLEERFGVQVNEQLRAARVLMQAFGTDGAGAMNILTAGFEGGLNSAEDLADTLQEYSTFFKALGLDADDTLNIIQRGLAEGARNTDYIGDAVKELGIRLGEAGTATTLAPLSAELAGLVQQFQAGAIEGPAAFQAIVNAIMAIEDPVARQAAGVALFGTKFEDLGVQVVTAMGQVEQNLLTSAGAADQAAARFTSLSEVGGAAFRALGEALLPINEGLLFLANGIAEANARAGGLSSLEAQLYAIQTAAKNTGIPEVVAQVGALETTITSIASGSEAGAASVQRLAESFRANAISADQFDVAVQALAANQAALAAASGETATRIAESAAALAYGEISATEFEVAVRNLLLSQEAQAGATEAQTGAADDLAAATEQAAAMLDYAAVAASEQETALRAATQAAYDAAVAEGDLEAQARAAAQALFEAGPAGAQAAAQLATSSRDIDVMTAAFYRLLAAKQAALGGGGAVGNLGGAKGLIKGAGAATAAARELNKVYGAGPLAPRGAPPRASGGGGGGRAGGGASAADKADQQQTRDQAARYDKLLSIQERYQEASLQAETRYQERLSDIAADFAAKRAEAERRFGDAQFDSRSDFYTSLAGVDKGQRTGMIQEFEAAQQRGTEIAGTSGADAAEQYLSAITQIIRDRAQRQADIAAALEGGDQAEAEFLKGVDAIARAAEQRKLDAAARGDDGLAGAERAARDEAAAQREEALTDAQRAAQDGLVDAERQKADAASVTNAQYAEQLRLVQQIAQAGGPPSGTPAQGASTPATTPTPPAAGLPAPAGAGVVAVRDGDVITALGQVTATLEGVRRALAARPNYGPGA